MENYTRKHRELYKKTERILQENRENFTRKLYKKTENYTRIHIELYKKKKKIIYLKKRELYKKIKNYTRIQREFYKKTVRILQEKKKITQENRELYKNS